MSGQDDKVFKRHYHTIPYGSVEHCIGCTRATFISLPCCFGIDSMSYS